MCSDPEDEVFVEELLLGSTPLLVDYLTLFRCKVEFESGSSIVFCRYDRNHVG